MRKGWLESKWTEVNGLQMHARVSANAVRENAPNVVLVHGMGISSRYFMPTAVLLAPEFRTYGPDLPGFGLSDKPELTPTVTEMADWLAAWMQAYGVESAAMVGNSFGCQIIAEFALRHPALIDCAAMVGPTTDPQGNSVREQLVRWRENDPNEPPSKRYICWRDYLDCGVRRLVDSFWFSLEDHIEGKLPHLRVPTLVIRGSRDPIVPQRWAEEAVRLLPQGRLIVIPGAYHTVNFSSPLELVRVLHPFITEHGRPAKRPTLPGTRTTSLAA